MDLLSKLDLADTQSYSKLKMKDLYSLYKKTDFIIPQSSFKDTGNLRDAIHYSKIQSSFFIENPVEISVPLLECDKLNDGVSVSTPDNKGSIAETNWKIDIDLFTSVVLADSPDFSWLRYKSYISSHYTKITTSETLSQSSELIVDICLEQCPYAMKLVDVLLEACESSSVQAYAFVLHTSDVRLIELLYTIYHTFFGHLKQCSLSINFENRKIHEGCAKFLICDGKSVIRDTVLYQRIVNLSFLPIKKHEVSVFLECADEILIKENFNLQMVGRDEGDMVLVAESLTNILTVLGKQYDVVSIYEAQKKKALVTFKSVKHILAMLKEIGDEKNRNSSVLRIFGTDFIAIMSLRYFLERFFGEIYVNSFDWKGYISYNELGKSDLPTDVKYRYIVSNNVPLTDSTSEIKAIMHDFLTNNIEQTNGKIKDKCEMNPLFEYEVKRNPAPKSKFAKHIVIVNHIQDTKKWRSLIENIEMLAFHLGTKILFCYDGDCYPDNIKGHHSLVLSGECLHIVGSFVNRHFDRFVTLCDKDSAVSDSLKVPFYVNVKNQVILPLEDNVGNVLKTLMEKVFPMDHTSKFYYDFTFDLFAV